MAKRNLRIIKRVSNVPVLGICEYCNAQFSADPNTGAAESAIQKQFNAHMCKLLEATPPAVATIKKPKKDK